MHPFLFSFRTMALTHLRESTNLYEFFFTSTDDLGNDNFVPEGAASCASDFSAQANIDLNPLTFLKSTNTEAALSTFSVNATPICFRQGEKIKILVETPHDLLAANTQVYPLKAKEIDQVPFFLETDDFCAKNRQDPLHYLNRLMANNINQFILFRLSQTCFDSDKIFKSKIFTEASLRSEINLTLTDIQLLQHYTTIANYTRLIYLHTLAEYIPTASIRNINLPAEYSPLTAETEMNLISSSHIFESLDVRTEKRDKLALPPIIDFTLFHDIDLTKSNRKRNNLDIAIRTAYLKTLALMLIDVNNLTPADKTFLTELQQSHLGLLEQSISVRKLLAIEFSRLTQDADPQLFQPNFLRLETTADNRTKFVINNSFLPADNTCVHISFPELVSYTLGTRNPKEIIEISNIRHDTNTGSTNRRKFTNKITNQNDQLYSPLKHTPAVIHILTDLLSENGIFNSIPHNNKNCHFNIIHSQKLDEDSISSGFIFKCPNELTFHPVLRPYNQLSKVRLRIVDSYFNRVYFPINSFVVASLKFRSTNQD